MIDLHCHSTASDGEFNAIELLKMAEEKKLEVFSITDHDDCSMTSFIMQEAQKRFSGSFISGIEVTSFCLGQGIEFLCYGFNPQMLESELIKVKHPSYWGSFKSDLIALIDVLVKAGAVLSDETKAFAKLSVDELKMSYVRGKVLKDFLSHKENEKLIDNTENFKSYSFFYRAHFTNSSSPFFSKLKNNYLSPIELNKIVHKCGGLMFLAHTFNYGQKAKQILSNLAENSLIDGVECMHKSFSQEQQDFLFDFAREHNLYTSGGSDFHRYSSSPFAEASMEQKIPSELVKPWLDKLSFKTSPTQKNFTNKNINNNQNL